MKMGAGAIARPIGGTVPLLPGPAPLPFMFLP
jgi:hypothetical protein